MPDPRAEIEEVVNRETRAWDTQDVDLLLTVLHPDMVWPWPPNSRAHDPIDWVLERSARASVDRAVLSGRARAQTRSSSADE